MTETTTEPEDLTELRVYANMLVDLRMERADLNARILHAENSIDRILGNEALSTKLYNDLCKLLPPPDRRPRKWPRG